MQELLLRSLKVLGSVTWRGLIFAVIFVSLLFLLSSPIAAFYQLFENPIPSIIFGMLCFFYMLGATQYILNRLPHIHYSDMRVRLRYYGVDTYRLTLYETLCILCSFYWRYYAMKLSFGFVMFLFLWMLYGMPPVPFSIFTREVLFLTSQPFLLVLYAEVVFNVIAFIWVLLFKKTGRHLEIQTLLQDHGDYD